MSRPSIQIFQILLFKQFTCQAHVLFYIRSIRGAARSGRRTPYNRAPASIRTSGIPHNMMRRASSCSLPASRADSFHNPYPIHIDRSFSAAWAVSRPHAERLPLFPRAVLPAHRVCRKLRSFSIGFSSGCRFSLGGCCSAGYDTNSAGVISSFSAISSIVSERIFC